MKTLKLFILILPFALLSCKTGEISSVQKVTFGIYETVKVRTIPDSITGKLKTANMTFEKDLQLPIIGYIPMTDTVPPQVDFSHLNIRIVRTFYPVDEEGKYYALVAIKQNPGIDNSDIKGTKNIGKNVEIHFNISGARKWAEMTKNNPGNMVAFTIDNQIYTMPYINGEINNGSALINGLENETVARQLSDDLNASIP